MLIAAIFIGSLIFGTIASEGIPQGYWGQSSVIVHAQPNLCEEK